MKNLCARLCWLFFLCAACALRAAEEPAGLVVEPLGEGEFDFNPQTGVARATNGVVVRYGLAVLTANQVTVHQNSGEVLAEGQVRIENEGQVWSGDKITYNFKTRELSSEGFRTGQRPFFVSGPGLETTLGSNRVYSTTNAVMTTDDYAEPGYTIHAKRITIYPGKQIVAQGATVWLGKVPVFYWPFMRRSLETHPNYWTLTPGTRSTFGPYLLSAYHYNWNEELETALNLDYRTKRGPGVGPDIIFKSPDYGEGKLRYYYTHDNRPDYYPYDENALPIIRQPIPETRQRIWYAHQATLRPHLTAKAMVRWQTDPFITRDFYEPEYRDNVQPSSFFELNQDWPNWNLNLYAQPQVNSFQETVERLPDIKLTGLRQEIGESPFYYDSESSAGYYRHVWPDIWTNSLYPFRPLAYSAMRADTYHQVLVPLNFFGWLNVTPRVGGRFTYYGEASGPGANTLEETRAVLNTGVEFSFKASRTWRGARSQFLEVNGLRHIVEPSLNYVYVPSPNVAPTQLPQFDSELPSYWLLPVTYPDYNAIDSIDSQNVMRFGLRNRLQTKREDGMDYLANWSLLTDWRLRPRPNQNTFAYIYSDLAIKPRSWLTLNSLMRYDPGEKRLRELTDVFTLRPSGRWSLSLGHRYRDEHEFGLNDIGDNLILTSFGLRFTDNWAFRATHQFQARDGRMEEQAYTIYRDLRSWTMALTFRYRDNRNGDDDYSLALTFSLKAFPRYGLGRDVDRPSLLLGN